MSRVIYPGNAISDYDFITSAFPRHIKLRKKVATLIKEHFDGSEGALVLEIGAGTGETTEIILKMAPNVRVVAVDIDKNMAMKLKKKLRAFVIGGSLDAICEDAFIYIRKLKDASLDGFTSSWTIHNFDRNDRYLLLREIHRVLKPGGIFVNMDKYVSDNPREEHKSFERAVKNLSKISSLGRPDIAREAIRHEEDDRHPDYIMKEKESMGLMKKIGFRRIRIHARAGREAVLSCLK